MRNRCKPVHGGHLIEFNAEPRWCHRLSDSAVIVLVVNLLEAHFWTSTLALPWICVLGQRFDHYEYGRLSWLGQLYGAL